MKFEGQERGIEECIDSVRLTGDSTCCLRDSSSSLIYCTRHPEYSTLWCNTECTRMLWKTRRNVLEGYGNHPDLNGKVWKLVETTCIVQNLGSVDPYSYPCHHTQPRDLWCQGWMMTSTPGDWSVTSVLCTPTPGPCNATHNVRHHPTWQGQLTCTSPTWGSRLCKSGMPACAVRVLKSTRVVLGLLRVIQAMLHSNLLWACRMTHAQYLCQVSGRSEWVEWAHCRWNTGISWRGGRSAHFTALLVHQSVTLLCQNPCSKSLLGAYPHVLPHLQCITVPPLHCIRLLASSCCWAHFHACCHISGTSTCIVVGQHITMWVHKPVTCTIRARAGNSRCTLPFPKQRGDKVITKWGLKSWMSPNGYSQVTYKLWK